MEVLKIETHCAASNDGEVTISFHSNNVSQPIVIADIERTKSLISIIEDIQSSIKTKLNYF